jgi:hypothetical protein
MDPASRRVPSSSIILLKSLVMTLFVIRIPQSCYGVLGFLAKNACYHRTAVQSCLRWTSFKKNKCSRSNIRACSFQQGDNNQSFSSLFNISLSIPTVETMEEVGALLSVVSQPPDVIFLDGDLGAGKTCFARGFIQCKLGLDLDDGDPIDDSGQESDNIKRKTPSLQVTSPTYLLSNTYSYHDGENKRVQE